MQAAGSSLPSAHTPTRKRPLSAEVADRMLDLLSRDDRYRELFQRDPLAALIQAGHPLRSASDPGEPALLPQLSYLAVRELASKQEIGETRELLHSFVTGTRQVAFAFEAGQVRGTLKQIA